MYINTNVSALFAENSLSNTQSTLNSLQQEMSTGYQINSPSDNPSGLAISNLMSGELGAINSATSNATEASNLLNTANGGMQTDIQIVQQIQQLAVQASNSTNNSQDTQDIQNQIQQLLVSMDNVSTTLNYNNQFVLGQGPSTSSPTPSNEFLSLGSNATPSAIVSVSGSIGSSPAALATVTENWVAGSGAAGSVGSVVVTLTYGADTFTQTVAAASSVSVGTGMTVVNFTSAGVGLNASVTVNLSSVSTENLTLATTAGGVFAAVSGSGFATTVAVTVTESFVAGSGSTPGTVVIKLQYGADTITQSIAGASSSTAGTGTVVVNLASAGAGIGSLALTVNLTAISTTTPASTTMIVSNLAQDSVSAGLVAASPFESVSVGADSGGLPAGTYQVQAYAQNGTDYLTILNSAGTTIATGSVANMASATGTVALQLVSGYNSVGSDSFIINVNQTDLNQATSVAMATASFSVASGQQYTFQTGPNQGSGNTLQTSFGSFNSSTLGLNNLDVTSAQGAQYAISQAESALSLLTNAQSGVGSQIDQINYTLTNLQTEGTNLQSSQASIMDANMAQVTSQFAQTQILEQTGIQALTTAQQLPSLVLKLLS